jgi:hypothetical protein
LSSLKIPTIYFFNLLQLPPSSTQSNFPFLSLFVSSPLTSQTDVFKTLPVPQAIRGLYKAFNFPSGEPEPPSPPTATINPVVVKTVKPLPASTETKTDVLPPVKKARGRPRKIQPVVEVNVDPAEAGAEPLGAPTRLVARLRPSDLQLGEYDYILVQSLVKVWVHFYFFAYVSRKG